MGREKRYKEDVALPYFQDAHSLEGMRRLRHEYLTLQSQMDGIY